MSDNSSSTNNVNLNWDSFSIAWDNKTGCVGCENDSWEYDNGRPTDDNGNDNIVNTSFVPAVSPNKISTQTHKIFLSSPIDLNIFWNIPVIEYTDLDVGVVKKEIKFATNDEAEFNSVQKCVENNPKCVQHVYTHIVNPNGRLKFKDSRKVTEGINKNDIKGFQSRRKPKCVFYNCIALTIRIKKNGVYKDVHNKVFNTGKVEIPGVVDDDVFDMVTSKLIDILRPYCGHLRYSHGGMVLTKSNFNCGYYVNLERLQDILKNKYGIHSIFDPCSYRGVKCHFMYNPQLGDEDDEQNGVGNINSEENLVRISFMIFRTGSAIIAGKCTTKEATIVYSFLKKLFEIEYLHIIDNSQEVIVSGNKKCKEKTWESLFGQNRVPIYIYSNNKIE